MKLWNRKPTQSEISQYVADIRDLQTSRNELIRQLGNVSQLQHGREAVQNDLAAEIARMDATLQVMDAVLRYLLGRQLPREKG